MSSPLARPRPGEPRYFVKRSPGGVSPAKMMSREEAAEMMMRTEFSAFSRGADDNSASASATPEKRPESPRATRAADTDKVAARLVAAANARAEDAERRAFETEERAAARVADAEHDARQMADALGDAQRVIAELEHHIATTAMRRDDREHKVASSEDHVADAERANAVAEANRRRLQAELEVDELKAKLEDAEKSLVATREAARRALEAREKDARSTEQLLEAKLRDTESAFKRERDARLRAEEISREHDNRRIKAIERLLKRTARRDEPSTLRAALLESESKTLDEKQNGDEVSSSFVSLTSAEEELVAIEGEHARELERLRAEVVAAKAEIAKSIARAEASDALLRKTRREGEEIKRENEHLYRVIDRSSSTLGKKGTSVVLRALKSLDAIEAKSVATYRVATRALDLARKSCDAAEDLVSSDSIRPSLDSIEAGVEQNWVVSRDVLSEAWSVAGETRFKLERVKDEANQMGVQLKRATTREANARVRADVLRRSKEFARLSVTDAYPKFSENRDSGLDEAAGLRLSTQTEAGTSLSEFDDLETPLRLTRRPMRVGSPSARGDRPRSASPGPPPRLASEARGRSPGRSPAAISSRSTERSPENRSPGDAGTRRAISRASRTPSPARTASPLRSSLSRSPSRASRSPGARRRVTFGENTTSVFSPAHSVPDNRPRSAPGSGSDGRTAVSRVGAYIRGETVSVVSATEEKKELARRAAVAASMRANAEARLKASNPRSRTAPRPWHSEPKAFGSTARRRPSSARSDGSNGTVARRSPTKTRSKDVKSGSSPFTAKNVFHSPSPAKRLAYASPSRDAKPHPPPRDAVIASQRSPSKSPPPPARRGTGTPSSRGR